MRTSRLAELALTLSLVPVEAIVGAALASAARSCHGQAATIVGTKGDDDAVTGGRSNETLIGGEGDDDLNGGPGDDLLDGGEGNDQIEGGRGAQNAVTYAHAPGGVEVNLPAGTATGWGTDTLAAIQVVIGSGFDDTIIGSGQRNTFIPGEGNDSVSGGGGPDTIDFSGGPDRDGRRPGGGNRRWAEDGHDHRGGGGHRIRARRHPDRERPAEHLDRRRGRRLPCSGTRARTRSTAGTIPTVWTAAPAPTPA